MIHLILNIIFISSIIYLAFRALKSDLHNLLFISGFIVRLAGGLTATLFFFEINPANDSVAFFNTADLLLKEHSTWSILTGDFDPGNLGNQPRVLAFVKILSLFQSLSGGSYWIVAVYFSVISFLVSWYFVSDFAKLYPQFRTVTIVCFLFIPSVVFWSSAVLKDTLAFAALLVAVIQTLKLNAGKRLSVAELVFGLISIITLLLIKHYLLITLLIFAGLTFGILVFRKFVGALKWFFSPVIILIFIISTQFIHPYLKFHRIPQTLFENNQSIAERTDEENSVGIEIENSDWISVIKEVPESLFTGLFRPTFFDKTPTIGLFHKLENLILLSMTFLSLILLMKEKPDIHWASLVPAIFCISLLATLLALSTPNLGSLVRYKNAFMPFLFLITSILPFRYFSSKTKG